MHYRKNLVTGEWVLFPDSSPSDTPSNDLYTSYATTAYEHCFFDNNHTPLIGLSQTELYDFFCKYLRWIHQTIENSADIMIHSIIKPSCTHQGTETESRLTIVPARNDFLDKCIVTAQTFYERHSRCSVCEMIQTEDTHNERIITRSQRFIALCPFFQRFPYETMIFPRKHSAQFIDTSDDTIHEFSLLCHALFNRIYTATRQADFSIQLHHIFVPARYHHCTHWYLDIIPRTTNWAGFEIATGININISLPEHCAKKLSKIH